MIFNVSAEAPRLRERYGRMANVEKDEKVSITRSASQWVYWQMFKKMKKSALRAHTL
jgi:hypothetical protein